MFRHPIPRRWKQEVGAQLPFRLQVRGFGDFQLQAFQDTLKHQEIRVDGAPLWAGIFSILSERDPSDIVKFLVEPSV